VDKSGVQKLDFTHAALRKILDFENVKELATRSEITYDTFAMPLIAIELDHETAREILAKWRRDLHELDAKRQEIAARMSTLEAKLSPEKIESPAPAQAQSRPFLTQVGHPSKAPRGENLRRVTAYLAEHVTASTGEIAQALGLTPSSVSSVLNNNSQFCKNEPDGRWFIYPPSQPSTSIEDIM
jgi:hypothetical protein